MILEILHLVPLIFLRKETCDAENWKGFRVDGLFCHDFLGHSGAKGDKSNEYVNVCDSFHLVISRKSFSHICVYSRFVHKSACIICILYTYTC